MEKKKKKIIAGALIFTILIGGYYIWELFFSGNRLIVEASGTIEALSVDLTAKVPGTIESIDVKPGDKVKQGEQIAKLSRSDLIAQRERDALNVAIAQNKLDDLLSGARSQQIKEAQANVNIRQAASEKARKDLERAEALYQEGSIALAELEVYQNNYTVAVNQLEAAKAGLSLLLAGSSDNQLKAAENQVKMMEAVLKSTEAVLADLIIASPLDGLVQSRNFERGEYVMAGAALATIVNPDVVWVNVYIPTDDLPYIKLGEKASIKVSGLNRVFEGTITEIATKGEFTPKTIQTKKERANIVYKVKIETSNPEGILKPGMPADVVIPKYFGSDQADDNK